MSITIRVPSSLSYLTGGSKEAECTGKTVAECLASLEEQFPGIKSALCGEQDNPLGFINVFVNGENINYLQGMETPLQDNDEITMIPAIAGG